MCCCKFPQKTISCFAKLLIMWSVLLVVGAGVIAYLSLQISYLEFLEKIPVTFEADGKSQYTLFEAIVAVGLVLVALLVLFAIWGCSVTCMSIKCCLCPYSLLLFIVSILFAIAGFILTLQAGSQDFLTKGCDLANNGQFTEFNYDFEKMLFGQISEVDNQIGSTLNENMCTQQCPCFKSSTAWATYNSINEATLKKFGRTKTSVKTDDYLPLFWTDQSKYSYNTFGECIDDMERRLSTGVIPAGVQTFDTSKMEKLKPILDLVKYVEDKFDCQGVCKAPLFFYSKDVIYGAPKQTCLVPLYETISPLLMWLGIVSIIMFVIMQLSFCMQFPLWRKDKFQAKLEREGLADKQDETAAYGIEFSDVVHNRDANRMA